MSHLETSRHDGRAVQTGIRKRIPIGYRLHCRYVLANRLPMVFFGQGSRKLMVSSRGTAERDLDRASCVPLIGVPAQ